jgi:hypothetical protein
MTITADSPQATAAATRTAPARTAGPLRVAQPPAVAPPRPQAAGPRTRRVPLTPMRQATAKSLRKLADHVQQTHPDMITHQHLRDAARVLESGNEEGAQRHLRAAIGSLTPQTMLRHGILDDAGHIAGKQAMAGVHRHLLLVKDIVDVAAKNQQAIRRDSYGDYESGPSLPHADPNAGYGPGALAQKPTARQPGGDRALNAPDRTNSGGSDPAVADPVGPQPKGSKQFATWDEAARAVELAWIASPSKGEWAAIDAKSGHSLPDAKEGSDEDKADSHIRAARQATQMGQHAVAIKHLARASALTSDPAKQEAVNTLRGAVAKNAALRGQSQQLAGLASSWDDVAAVVELAASRGRMITGPVTGFGASGRGYVFGEPTWDDLASVVEMSVSPAITGTIDARTPATAGTARGHGQPVRSRPTWPVNTRTPTMRTSITGSRSGEAPRRSTPVRVAAAGRQPTGPRSTAGTGQARTTSYRSASDVTTSTTDLARAIIAASDTASSSSPMSRSLTSTIGALRDQLPWPGNTECLSRQSTRSSTAGTGGMSRGHPNLGVDEAGAGRAFRSAVELSAKTAMLEATPAPYGKPGGPGLYGVKGNKHSDYVEQIVKALMRKGMDKGKATAIARGSIRRWMVKSKHPEVRAASGLAEAEELKAQARAHAHAATWDDVGAVIDLAAAPPPKPDAHQAHIAHLQHLATHGTPSQQAAAKTLLAGSAKSATASAQPRVAAGVPAAGQFAPAGSGGTAPAGKGAKAAATAKTPAAGKPKAAGGKTAAAGTVSAKAAHAAHVAHLQHLATHGTPQQQTAAKAVLARLGVKP